jgi:peptidoglycan/xylan/chitin deacetylase (PgdA/CDA1 family)
VSRLGFPVLERLGVPATVFVPTEYAGSQQPMAWAGMSRWLGTPFEPELECMSWDELRGLRDAGWEIGSHTRTHRDLATLTDAELDAELRGSREECEAEIGRPCRGLAYPFSSFDARVKRAAAAAGYEAALILDSEPAIRPQTVPLPSGTAADPMEMLRAGIYGRDGWPRFLAKTSPAVRRARLKAGGALANLRRSQAS